MDPEHEYTARLTAALFGKQSQGLLSSVTFPTLMRDCDWIHHAKHIM